MKKQLFPMVLLLITIGLTAQENKSDVLQNLEQNNKDQNVQNRTATLKSASRLFGAKDDLTSVIMVLPSGTNVDVLVSDSTYYKVAYNNDQGFIFKKDATLDEGTLKEQKSSNQQMTNNNNQQVQAARENPQDDSASRQSYLENKYGTRMASLLSAGKIWKGMTADMVRDSWGPPAKINKTFEGNLVKEEWLYRNTWLYVENDILSDWGPIKK